MQAKRCSFKLIYRAIESRYSIAHFYIQKKKLNKKVKRIH